MNARSLLYSNAPSHLLAYSGGLDSTVLLHLAVQAQLAGLSAVHIHHGLQAQADDWAAHCQQQCAALGVPLRIERVSVASKHPQGPEAAARAARYAALRALLPEGARLLTAHHQQDQAETLLLRLLRGTGVEGLAAMQPFSPFGKGQLWRPLLQVPRAVLRAHAEAQGLRWLEDPHNTDPRYTRSWLRREVMPLLQARQPQAAALLARTAALAAEAAEILGEVATADLQGLQRPDNSLHIPGLLALSPARRHGALREWFSQRQLPLPHAASLALLEQQVLAASPDATPLLAWPGVEVRRYRQQLFASAPLPPLPDGWQAEWTGEQPLDLPMGCGRLHALAPLPAPVQVRLARGGERIRPAGQAHHRSLKQLAQSAGVPPWVRARLPMVFAEGQLVSVAGRWTIAGGPQLRWQPADTDGAEAQ